MDLKDINTDSDIENPSYAGDDSGIYEVGFQIIPTLTEEEVVGVFSLIKDVISKKDGKIISEGTPELVNLQYEMRKKISGKYQKFLRGYFGWVKFEIAKQDIKTIKDTLEGIVEILRMIIISTVRENTMISQKPHTIKRPIMESPTPVVLSPEAMDEEIAKTLENLEIK